MKKWETPIHKPGKAIPLRGMESTLQLHGGGKQRLRIVNVTHRRRRIADKLHSPQGNLQKKHKKTGSATNVTLPEKLSSRDD